MDIKEIYLKNFRNIGEDGSSIKLSPITIFTGCNSAGKSTAAKALLLLEAYLSDVKANNYNLIDTPLDFSKVVKLGTFDTVLNESSRANGHDFFVLGYSFESAILVADIRVRLTFKKKNSDTLNNAWLNELTILIDSTELLSIQIIDGHYFFEIKDKEKLIEYIRCYKIRHIVSLCREYDGSRREREEWRRISEINPQPIEDEWAKARAYIPAIKNIERKLVSDNIMHGTLSEEKRDSTFKEKPSSKDIISAIENIVEFESIWMKAYKIELDNKRRFSMDDLNRILESKRQDYKKDFDQLKKRKSCPPFDYFWKEEISNTVESFRLYVDSDSKNIIEYKKGQNYIVLDNFINKINNSDFQLTAMSLAEKRGKDLGILGLFSCAPNPIGDACKYLLNQSLNPYLLGRVGYVDASTVEVRRLYPLDFSDRFGNLWKRFNEEKPRRQYSNPIEKGEFLRKWLREFQICEDIVVENMEGALKIKLISSSMTEGRLLADYGYGVTQLVALLLNIEIAINNAEDGPVIDMVEESGQLDVLIGTLPYLLILEEPEVHLHPSLQSRLADVFVDAARHGVHFIVETHSEYLVRRSQVIVASKFEKTPKYIPSFGVYYFPENNIPYNMGFQKNGKFIENFGPGFFDVADNSAMDLFEFEGE